jgi:sulfur-oxidizing protein SoxY
VSVQGAATKRRGRRRFLLAAGALAAGLPSRAQVRALPVDPDRLSRTIATLVGSARVSEGRVRLELPPLVENGNVVPLAVSVASPMTEADHVRAIHVLNEKNPLPEVVTVRFGPRAGRARVATRIRLADTQNVVALAEMSDGTFWSHSVHVVVTLAACLEEV